MIKINSNSAPQDSFSQKAQLAFTKAKSAHVKQISALLKELETAETTCQKVRALRKPGQTIAIVGIGGSSLGLQVIQEYFAIQNVVYFENIDPLEIEMQISQVPLNNTVWIFISKSGETIETLATLELIQQYYSQKSEAFFQNCVVITEKKQSNLTAWASENKVIQIELPMDVGGRYSILTSVGLIPSYFWNLRLDEFARGAKQALAQEKLIVQLVSESLQSFARNELITVLWSYSSRYKKFGFWWQQLWAESLSKKSTRTGQPAPLASTPLPLVGPTDQHSVLQQIVEGQKDKFVIFLRNSISESGKIKISNPVTEVCRPLAGKTLGVLLAAEANATQKSLDAVKVSNITIEVSEHSELSLGFLFMFFQLTVLSLGEALEINPVDQPGVELGKKICKEILSQN